MILRFFALRALTAYLQRRFSGDTMENGNRAPGDADGGNSLTIKATPVMAIIAIWAIMIPAIVIEPGGWPALIPAFLATIAIAISIWRRLGMARVMAIAGTWLGAAIAIAGDNGDNAWLGIFAMLSTSAIVYSFMRRDAFFHAGAIAAAWLVTGAIAVDSNGGSAWVGVLAFLTTLVTAQARRNNRHAIFTGAAWLLAGAISIAVGDHYWIAVFGFVVAVLHIPFGGVTVPRQFEWDIRDGSGPRRSSSGTPGASRTSRTGTGPIDIIRTRKPGTPPNDAHPWR